MPSDVTEHRERLSVLADGLAHTAGSPWTSGISMVFVAVVLVAGFVAGFPLWWQTLVYATGALASLLILFSIQHSTNRQTKAVLLKLDELIQATNGADDGVIAIERRRLHDQERIHNEQHRQAATGDRDS